MEDIKARGGAVMILYIDTSNKDKVVVKLDLGEEVVWMKGSSKKMKAQQVLPLIDKLLSRQGVKLKELDGIKINPGPGSFTGLRVGLAVANSIGWALDIPVEAPY